MQRLDAAYGLPVAKSVWRRVSICGKIVRETAMYLVLMILIALAAAAVVFLLEHRGDPRALEREYGSRLTLTDKNRFTAKSRA